MKRLSITKFRNYVLIDLMVDLNITSCQASVFRSNYCDSIVSLKSQSLPFLLPLHGFKKIKSVKLQIEFSLYHILYDTLVIS